MYREKFAVDLNNIEMLFDHTAPLIKVLKTYIFYSKAIKVHLISHNIYSKSRRTIEAYKNRV